MLLEGSVHFRDSNLCLEVATACKGAAPGCTGMALCKSHCHDCMSAGRWGFLTLNLLVRGKAELSVAYGSVEVVLPRVSQDCLHKHISLAATLA